MQARSPIPTLIVLSMTLIVTSARDAAGQIRQCNGIPSNARYKVLLDDVRSTGPQVTAAQTLIDDLEGVLELQMTEMSLNQGLSFVRCGERFPRGESDFIQMEVERLNRRNVLIEIWMTLKPPSNQPEAELACALIPVFRHSATGNVPKVYKLPALRLPASGAAMTLPDPHLDVLLALARIGAGVKYLNDDLDYDLSVEYLCQGLTLLTRQGVPPSPSPLAKLVGYAKQQMRRAVDSARGDPGYQGMLREQEADNVTCGKVGMP